MDALEVHRVGRPELHGVDALDRLVGFVVIVGDKAAGEVFTLVGEVGLAIERLQIERPSQGVLGKIVVERVVRGVLKIELGVWGVDACDEELHLLHLHRAGEVVSFGIEIKGFPVFDDAGPVLGRQRLGLSDVGHGAGEGENNHEWNPPRRCGLFHHQSPVLVRSVFDSFMTTL